MPATGTYGKRGRLRTENETTGTRLVSPTYGRPRIRTLGTKSGDILIESQTERLVAHMLSIDPRVVRFRPQPFTVDLNGQRLLTRPAQVKEVLAQYERTHGPRIYTPDFCVDLSDAKQVALEVKTDTFPGDERYAVRLARAGAVLSQYNYVLVKVVLRHSLSGPLKQNLQLLQQAKRLQGALPLPTATLELLHQLEGLDLTLGDVCRHLNLPLNFAPTLVLAGAMSFDLSTCPFHALTPVKLAYGELEHLQLVGRLA